MKTEEECKETTFSRFDGLKETLREYGMNERERSDFWGKKEKKNHFSFRSFRWAGYVYIKAVSIYERVFRTCHI